MAKSGEGTEVVHKFKPDVAEAIQAIEDKISSSVPEKQQRFFETLKAQRREDKFFDWEQF